MISWFIIVEVGVFIISESVTAKERGPSEGDFGLKCLEEILNFDSLMLFRYFYNMICVAHHSEWI